MISKYNENCNWTLFSQKKTSSNEEFYLLVILGLYFQVDSIRLNIKHFLYKFIIINIKLQTRYQLNSTYYIRFYK